MAKPTPSQSPRKDFTPKMDSVVDTHSQSDLDLNTGKMTPSSLSQLENLPEELLELTVGFVASENDKDHFKNLRRTQKALHSLCLTSKSLYRIALPHFYRVYRHTDTADPTNFSVGKDHSHNDRCLQRFAQSVAETPWLAECIRELHLSQYEPKRISQWSPPAVRSDALQITSPFLPDPKRDAAFMEEISFGEPNATAAALLIAASHLERLTISFDEIFHGMYASEDNGIRRYSFKNQRWLGDVIKAAATENSPGSEILGHLQSIHIRSPCDFEDDMTADTEVLSGAIQNAFLIPTLRQFKITAASFIYLSFKPNKRLENRISNITDFCLCAADVGCSLIVKMIAWCRLLERVSIQWNTSSYDEWPLPDQNPISVFESLQKHCDTLESLSLNSILLSAEWGLPQFQLSSFTKFKNLNYLALDERCIRGTTQTGDDGDQERSTLWPPQLKHFQLFSKNGPSFHLEALGSVIQCQPPSSLETFTSIAYRTDRFYRKYCEYLKPYTSDIFEADISFHETEECQIRISTKQVAYLVKRSQYDEPKNEDLVDFPTFFDDPTTGGVTKPVRQLFRDIGIAPEIHELCSGFLEPNSRTQECPVVYCYDDDSD